MLLTGQHFHLLVEEYQPSSSQPPLLFKKKNKQPTTTSHHHHHTDALLDACDGHRGLYLMIVALYVALQRIIVGKFRMVLRQFHELPSYYREQGNHHIRSGYRIHFRRRDCLRTIVRWHNETLNIHTHLFGFVLFARQLVGLWPWLEEQQALFTMAHPDKRHQFYIHEHWLMFAIYFAACCQCLGSSAIYHTFNCHSACTFKKLLTLDYSGISSLIFASQVPPLYYAFYNDPLKMQCILVGLVVVTLSSAAAAHLSTWIRLLAFITQSSYVLVLLSYEVWRLSYTDSPADATKLALGLKGIGYAAAVYGVGAVLFTFRLPERLSPGSFDFLFHSHQWWHCFVVAGAWQQYIAVKHFYAFWLYQTCNNK